MLIVWVFLTLYTAANSFTCIVDNEKNLALFFLVLSCGSFGCVLDEAATIWKMKDD